MAHSGNADRTAAHAQDDEATLSDAHHLAIRSLEDVREPVDPRLSPDDRPDNERLDESYVRQLDDYIHHRDHHLHKPVTRTSEKVSEKGKEKEEGEAPSEEREEEPLYVEFEEGDPRDPANFSLARKRAILLTGCLFAVLVGACAPWRLIGLII